MFDLSRKKSKPGTFYALAFCVNVISFVMLCAGAFTPNWSKITEFDGTNEVVYERGLVISCDVPGQTGCAADANFGNRSGEILASFVMVIFAIILGFFTLQLLVLGQCVRSCREQNLGVPLTVLAFVIAILLIAALVLFEVSITKETTAGYSHRKDTFGFSRGIIVGALLLYFTSAFFSLGEHFKRKQTVGNNEGCNTNSSTRPSAGVFSIKTSHHNVKQKRMSHSDGPSGNSDHYFRNRGSYLSNQRGRPPIELWR